MSSVFAGLNVPPIATLFWLRATATADGSGNATFSFGTSVGSMNYLMQCKKVPVTPTLLRAVSTPQYQGGVTIPANRAQSIPLDTSAGADPTIAIFPIDDSQNLQITVTGLDAAGVYEFLLATNYSYGRC